jgi:hypothetical protein
MLVCEGSIEMSLGTDEKFSVSETLTSRLFDHVPLMVKWAVAEPDGARVRWF